MPFDELKTPDAQARLSVCRPISGLTENSFDGMERYAHLVGNVFYRKRAIWQLASTMGFVVSKNTGGFARLRPQEMEALHEILVWGAQPGNNSILEFFGPKLGNFDECCRTLIAAFRTHLPEGSLKARIRATTRESRRPLEGSLGEQLGEESTGLVTIDFQGHPLKYDMLQVYHDIVAQHTHCRLDLEAQTDRGGWRRLSSVNVQDEPQLDDQWRANLRQGVQHIQAGTYVTACDPHYDAKLFVHAHNYGTGSLNSEPGGCTMKRLCRNRAFALQSVFRRSTEWAFFQSDNALKHKLFWNNKAKRALGRTYGASDQDRFSQMYGTVVPSSIPESTAWWKRQTKELAAITDDAEAGLMQIMVTVTG